MTADTQDAERLAEIRRMVDGVLPLGDVYAKLHYIFAQLDARDARIALLTETQANHNWWVERAARLEAALAQAEAKLDRYGQHEPACPRRNAGYYPCECGLAAPAPPERTP